MLSGTSSSRDSAPDLGRVSAGRQYFRTSSGRMLQKLKRHLPGTTVRPASPHGPRQAVHVRDGSAWRGCMGSVILQTERAGAHNHLCVSWRPAVAQRTQAASVTKRGTRARMQRPHRHGRLDNARLPVAGRAARPAARGPVRSLATAHAPAQEYMNKCDDIACGGTDPAIPEGAAVTVPVPVRWAPPTPRCRFGRLRTWSVSMLSCSCRCEAQRRPLSCARSCVRGLLGCRPGSRGTVCMLSCCCQAAVN